MTVLYAQVSNGGLERNNSIESELSDNSALQEQAFDLIYSVCQNLESHLIKYTSNNLKDDTINTVCTSEPSCFSTIPVDDIRLYAKAFARLGEVQKVLHIAMYIYVNYIC